MLWFGFLTNKVKENSVYFPILTFCPVCKRSLSERNQQNCDREGVAETRGDFVKFRTLHFAHFRAVVITEAVAHLANHDKVPYIRVVCICSLYCCLPWTKRTCRRRYA